MIKLIFLIIPLLIISCSSNEVENESIQPTKSQISSANLPPLKNKIGNHYTIETTKDGHDEAIMELNQNLTFYCMKKTRMTRFKNEQKCLEFVQNSLGDCERKHKSANSLLVKCVKKKLNLK